MYTYSILYTIGMIHTVMCNVCKYHTVCIMHTPMFCFSFMTLQLHIWYTVYSQTTLSFLNILQSVHYDILKEHHNNKICIIPSCLAFLAISSFRDALPGLPANGRASAAACFADTNIFFRFKYLSIFFNVTLYLFNNNQELG